MSQSSKKGDCSKNLGKQHDLVETVERNVSGMSWLLIIKHYEML